MKKFKFLSVLLASGVLLTACSSGTSTSSSESGATTTATTKKAEDNVPAEYKSALKKAETYSKTMHMSKKAIEDQLVSQFDKFTPEAAKYAIDNLEADYKKNALEKAKVYQNTMNMSPAAIKDQLVSQFDQFTPEEAEYAVANLGK